MSRFVPNYAGTGEERKTEANGGKIGGRCTGRGARKDQGVKGERKEG